MKLTKICKDTLNALCESEDLINLSDIPKNLKEHIKSCKQCSSYRNSLIKTIELYKRYDINLDKKIEKKLICNVCEKLKEAID